LAGARLDANWCAEVPLEREPELGGNAPVLGTCPLDESLVVVGIDERRDRNSLLVSHVQNIATIPQRYWQSEIAQERG
jgi:hypothetical protein